MADRLTLLDPGPAGLCWLWLAGRLAGVKNIATSSTPPEADHRTLGIYAWGSIMAGSRTAFCIDGDIPGTSPVAYYL